MSEWIWSIDGWIVLIGVLSATSCTLLGNYLVLRKMSLMGDAISHAVLPGLAIAFLISNSRASLPMFLGAVIVGGLTALLAQTVHKFGKVESGAAMGVIFSIFFAIGLILIRQAADHVDLDPGCVLYGNMEQIPLEAIGGNVPTAVWTLLAVFVANALFVGLFYKELKISSFDPELATTLGINATAMHYVLMIMVAITTVANFEAVGSILVIAMLIVPAAAAHLLTDRLSLMLFIALAIAVLSAVAGHITASFAPGWFGLKMSTGTASMMAVVSGLMLLGAVLFSPSHGVLSKLYNRLKLQLQIAREDILGLLYRRHELAADGTRPLSRDEILRAVGDSWQSRRSLQWLVRRGQVETSISEAAASDNTFHLTSSGLAEAGRVIRAHRLWESYLDQHFLELPRDHQHLSAERWEHFLSTGMRQKLDEALTSPKQDPHGKEIPGE